MKKLLFSIVFVSFCSVFSTQAQKLFVPGGLVGTSGSSTVVEVGTATSGAILKITNSGSVGSGPWGFARASFLSFQNQYSGRANSLTIGSDGSNGSFYIGRNGDCSGCTNRTQLSFDVNSIFQGTFKVNQTANFEDKIVIGTSVNTPAGYRLYVQDGILTEKLKVAVKNSDDWADYVFAKDYQLKSLEEVETYINENNHLPDVPSAEEVVESGIDVAQMDALLLQKIEELTLYVIQLKAELNALKQ